MGTLKVGLLPMRAEELKGHLDALLLAALEGGPRHGYAVIEALRRSTGGRLDLPTGTIYPALRRLEAAGRVTVGGGWALPAGVHADRGRPAHIVGQADGLAGLRCHGQRRPGGQAMAEPSLTGDYLAELSACLPASIVAELADGLEQTHRHYLSQGLGVDAAAKATLAEFGEPEVIVAAY